MSNGLRLDDGGSRRTVVIDYSLAAILLVLPLVLDFDDVAAKWIAFGLGVGAAVLAVATAWSTGIVRIIPPLLHGYADITVTVALIVLPFIVGFSSHTVGCFYSDPLLSSGNVISARLCSYLGRKGAPGRVGFTA